MNKKSTTLSDSDYRKRMEYHHKTTDIEHAEELFAEFEQLYWRTVSVNNGECVKLLFCFLHELQKEIIELRKQRHALLVNVYPPQIKDGGDNV